MPDSTPIQILLDRLHHQDRLRVLAISANGFVFDPMSGQSFTLNSSGYDLLQMAQTLRDEKALLSSVTDTYDIDSERARIALEGFLNQLTRVLS